MPVSPLSYPDMSLFFSPILSALIFLQRQLNSPSERHHVKDPKIIAEIAPLKKSNQFYAAAQRRIDATINRDVPTALSELRTDVGLLLKEAIANDLWQEAQKILKQHKYFLHLADFDEAQLQVNEITIPEDMEEVDEIVDLEGIEF
jgi:hypothetical protein